MKICNNTDIISAGYHQSLVSNYKKAAQKLEYLVRAGKYFSAEPLMSHYKAQMRSQIPYLEFRDGNVMIFYRYFSRNKLSTDIASLVPPTIKFKRNTRLAENAHPWAVILQTSKTSCNRSCFPYLKIPCSLIKLLVIGFPSHYNVVQLVVFF